MRIYDGDADREVGGRESRVQMAKAPRAERTSKGRGRLGRQRGSVIKGDPHCVGHSDRKSPPTMQNCES